MSLFINNFIDEELNHINEIITMTNAQYSAISAIQGITGHTIKYKDHDISYYFVPDTIPIGKDVVFQQKHNINIGNLSDIKKILTDIGDNISIKLKPQLSPWKPTVPAPTAPTVPVPTVPAPTVPAPTAPTVPAPTVPTVPAPTAPAPTAPTVPAPTVPTVPAPTVPTVPAPTVPAPKVPTVPAPTVPAPKVPTVPIQKINKDELKKFIKCKCLKLGVDIRLPLSKKKYDSSSRSYIDIKDENEKIKVNEHEKYINLIKRCIDHPINCDLTNINDTFKNLEVNMFKKDNYRLFRDQIVDKNDRNDLIEKIIKMYELDYLYNDYFKKLTDIFNQKSIFLKPEIKYDNIDDSSNDLNTIKLSDNDDDNKKLIERIKNFINLYKQYIDAKVELLFTGNENVLKLLFDQSNTKPSFDIHNSETKYYALANTISISSNHTNTDFNNPYLYKYRLLNEINKFKSEDDIKYYIFDIVNYLRMYQNIVNILYPESKIIDTYWRHSEKKSVFIFKNFNKDFDIKPKIYKEFIKKLNMYYPEFIEAINLVQTKIQQMLDEYKKFKT